MRLKKMTIITLLFTTICTSSMSNVTNASTNDDLLQAEKYEGVNLRTTRKIIERSEKEKEADKIEAEKIKKRGEEKIKEDITKDVETIKELADILGDVELASKAGPVTEIPIEDIKYIMDVIVESLENYEMELSEEMKNELNSYILSHGPYVGSDKVKEYIERESQTNARALSTSYDRGAAVAYAFKWVHSYNTTYYPNLTNIGGDCTNFVSQAINAGGYPMTFSWRMEKINNKYLTPMNSVQFRYSWATNWPDESPWMFAPAFAQYWQPKVLTGEYNASFVADSPQVPYSAPYYLGDVVQIMRVLKNNGTVVGYEPVHSTIITNYSPENKDYRVSYHTENTKDKLLSHLADSYRNYRIRFYRMGAPR